MDQIVRFKNRQDAGQKLVQHLTRFRGEKAIVLALPRGGVVVGYEIARELRLPLDVVIARKLGAPFQPELGIGAVAPGGVRILDESTIRLLGISKQEIEDITEEEVEEMNRRLQRYRGNRPAMEIMDRTVILVDDGIATGVTARAAIQSIRQQKPFRIILAVPIAPPETVKALEAKVEELFCLIMPPALRAISLWYDNFDQTTDEEVITLLERSWKEEGA